MQTLRAVLGGKVVEYPMQATFIVERTKGKKKHRFLRTKPTITAALTLFHRAEDDGHGKPKLHASHQGKTTRLL